MRALVIAVVATAALALAGTAAAKECKPVSGDFVADTVPCDPPGPFCTAGTLTGDLDATYAFRMTSAAPTPTGIAFTGNSVITRKHGGAQLFGSDHGTIDFVDGSFTTIVDIVGGTKQYKGATGQIVATGHLTPTGTAGTYTGTICKHSG